MKTKELSELINVKPKTINSWVRIFNLDVDQTKKGLEFSHEDIELIKQIAEERENGHGLDTIQRKLTINDPEINKQLPVNEVNEPVTTQSEPVNNSLINRIELIENNVADRLSEKIDKIGLIAEKMSNLAYELGSSKANNKHLTEQLTGKDQVINEQKTVNHRLINQVSEQEKEINSLRNALENSEKNNKNLQEINQNLVIENTELKDKLNQGFFKKLFGSSRQTETD